MMSPVGPEAPTVYWVRRAAVVLILVTLVAGIWWLLAGGSDPAPTSSPSPVASATGASTAAATPAASSSATSSLPAPDPAALCPDGSIGVTATTDSTTYKVGSAPRLTLTIQNIGSFACTRDVGPKANALKITSGGYPIWSSDDCNASDTSKLTVLQASEKVASSITWDGHQTSKTCSSQGPLAKAGSYELTGVNGVVLSEPTPFALTSKG
jgi:hypothetical protein